MITFFLSDESQMHVKFLYHFKCNEVSILGNELKESKPHFMNTFYFSSNYAAQRRLHHNQLKSIKILSFMVAGLCHFVISFFHLSLQ